jgi:regulatory protein
MLGEDVITSVEVQKKQKHRYNIFINDQFSFAVHEDVLMKHRLFKGQSVDPGKLQEVLMDEERQDAYLKALRWLGNRQRTEREIWTYLKKKEYEDTVIDDCIKRLEAQRYVDDIRLSRTLSEERLKLQGKGKQWIRQELLHKGVDKGIVQETIASIDAADELESATVLARKRWKTLSGQEDQLGAKRKLYGFLARRGFSSSAVQQAVKEATAGSGNVELEEDPYWE